MNHKIIFLLSLCGHTTIFNNPIVKIVPFLLTKHVSILTECCIEHYPELFSSSPDSPGMKSHQARRDYAFAQAMHIGALCNELGQIDNKVNGSITTTKVLEINDIPAGYIKYTSCHPLKSIGKIDQLAILNKHRRQNLGNVLMCHALDDFYKNDAISFAYVLTTTKTVGEKFYQNKLGFSFLDEQKSLNYPDETLFRWGARIRNL